MKEKEQVLHIQFGYINTMVYQAGKRKHIFHKGSDKFGVTEKWRAEGGEEINTAQMAFPNNSPGLFLHEDKIN